MIKHKKPLSFDLSGSGVGVGKERWGRFGGGVMEIGVRGGWLELGSGVRLGLGGLWWGQGVWGLGGRVVGGVGWLGGSKEFTGLKAK